MRYIIKEFAIVVLAQSNNPTILNKDFLRTNKICPYELEPIAESILCTPAVSKIEFKNGISIFVDTDKISFTNISVKTLNDYTFLSDIAISYLETLPHVKYTALGTNFTGHFEELSSNNVKEFLLEKFFSEKAWGKTNPPSSSLTLNFAYKRDNIRFNINLGQGALKDANGSLKELLFLKANCHRDLLSPPVSPFIDAIKDWEKTKNQFIDIINDIFEIGEN